jgi:hypothetical protein
MSASVLRPSVRQMFESSRDALDIAEDIQIATGHARTDADKLFAYPADSDLRIAVRMKAREIIRLCDELERLQQPSPVVSMGTFRRPS